MKNKDEGLTSSPNDSNAPVGSSVFGHYTEDGRFVNDNGQQVCEWCGSTKIYDPISEDCLNGLCTNCGSHW